MRRRHGPTLLALLLFAILQGACGAAEEAGPDPNHLNVDGPPAITTMPEMVSVTGKSLPLEAFQIGPQALSTISLARQLLIADCMKRFGYTYEIQPSGPPAQADRLSRRYGITDAASAARWGYGGPPGQAPTSKPRRSADPNQALVLTGWPNGRIQPGGTPPAGQNVGGLEVPQGGCSGEAGRKLTGDDAGQIGDDPLVRDIDASAYSKAESDPRVLDMQAKWSACMREKGYDYPHSLAVVDAITRTGGDAPAAEIQTALADVECKGRTNYIGIWFTVESAYQNALIEKNFQALTTIKARADRQISMATSVVAAGK